MFFYLLLITFTMIYAANIPPAAVFEDNDSFSAPSDFMIGSESNESLQKYITRDKYSKQLEPSMDSYVRAYKKFHEKYQTAEEKSMDEINRENQNSIDHKIKKRSAPPTPSSPPREMIKFELSDAKVPDFMTTKLLSTRVPPNIADAVYDSATPATDKDAKSSGSRMIKIVHPIRSSRGISLDTFSAPVSKASFKLYLNDKNNPFLYKGPYSPVSQRPKFSTSSRNFSQTDRTVSLSSGQNQLGPHQTPGLKEYSGKTWKRPQSRPSAQYVPTVKKVPQFGYTIPPVSSLSNSLSNTLTVSSLSSLAKPQKTYTSILEGVTATDSNRFGEPFRSSLSDPTFSFDEGGLAALTALIGKEPNQQLKALDELLKKDQQTRPQDSTSPILFHPTTESSFRASTTPKSVDFFPESEAGRLAFEDITRFYGGRSLPTPFTPSDDHKPIFETVTESPERPTPPPILISPTAVTLRTPEDVLRIPGEFQASALVDQEDDKVSRGRGRRHARELRNIPVRDFRNSFDPLVLQEAFSVIGDRDILMTPLPTVAPHWQPVTPRYAMRYVDYLRRKNSILLRTFNEEIPERRVRRSAKAMAFKDLANETLSYLPMKDVELVDPDGDKVTGNSTEYLDYEDYDFDENATISEDFPDYPLDEEAPIPGNSSRRYDQYEYPEDSLEVDESVAVEYDHNHSIEYKLVPVTVYKKVPVLKRKPRKKWHPKRRPRFRKHKRRPRRPRFKKFRPIPKFHFKLIRR